MNLRFLLLGAFVSACGSNAASTTQVDNRTEPAPAPQRPAPPEPGEDPPPPPPATWCTERTHAFCADFDADKSKWAKHGFDDVWFGGALGGSYELVEGDRSPPHALSITEPKVEPGEPGSGFSFARAVKVASSKGARVNLDLYIDSIGIDKDTYAISPVSLTLRRTEGKGRLSVASTRLDLRSTRTELHVWPNEDKGSWSVPAEHFPRDRWVHVELTIDLATTPATATMRYDGKVVASGTHDALDPSTIEDVELRIGMTVPVPHPSAVVEVFDNVTLDTL